MAGPVRQPLNRRAVLQAALDLADERGLTAVSMRAVADRVGVTPMALYPHIGSKAALLDGIVDLMLAEYLPRTQALADQPWDEQLRGLGYGIRELANRHPSAFILLFERPAVTPDAVRMVDVIYRIMLAAGVPEGQVLRMERLFTTFCLGYALSEVNGRFSSGSLDPRARRAGAAAGTVPAHERLAAQLDADPDWSAEYAADIEDLVGVVARVASA